MTNDPLNRELRERSWRGKLSGAEEAKLRAWLAAHPQEQADWEADAALSEALARLPDAPVATNFTARVLAAVEQADVRRKPMTSRWAGWLAWPRWVPKAAFAALVLGAGLFSYRQVMAARRAEMAWSVAAVSGVSSLPSPDVLTNFDVICSLDPAPAPDLELLALFR
jgi:anti-sigma factor RsiW